MTDSLRRNWFILVFSHVHMFFCHRTIEDFQLRFPGSIKSTKVGFMSPDEHPRIKNPTYRDVCTGRSGHGKLSDPLSCSLPTSITVSHSHNFQF